MGAPNKPNIFGIINQAAGAAQQVGNILGIGNKKQDKRQIEQQSKLQALQIKGGKELADYQNEKQLEMWKATNYKPQVEELKKAGLNPALLYGMSGGGGATTGGSITTGVSGGDAANAAATKQADASMAMTLANMELIKAQTEKTKAEANKIEGADTRESEARTASLTQGINNQKATEELTKIQSEIAGIDAKIKNNTIFEAMDIIMCQARIAEGQATSALMQGNLDERTIDDKVNIIKQEYMNKALEAVATKSNISLNDAKIREINQGIMNKIKELNLTESKNRWEHEDRLKAVKEYTETSLKTAGIIAAGNVAGDLVQIATRRIPKGKTTTTEDNQGNWKWTEETYK